MAKQEQTEFEKKVLEQFMSGKNLFGEGGAFAPLLKNVIEKALEAEMEVYSPRKRATWLFRSDHASDFGITVPLRRSYNSTNFYCLGSLFSKIRL